MTIRYRELIEKAGRATFFRLFFLWRGSVWKAVYHEVFWWIFAYLCLCASYRLFFSEYYKLVFEELIQFFGKSLDFMPLTFMLGFFVRLTIDRWWDQWRNIGFIDNLALQTVTQLPGNDDEPRMYRRGIIRYMLFLQVQVFRSISTLVRKRFPTNESLVTAGYVTKAEMEKYVKGQCDFADYYTPVKWAMNLAHGARAKGLISTDPCMNAIILSIESYRAQMATLLTHSMVPLPLSYTQVVCFSVRCYFFIALIGRQATEASTVNFYFEIFPFMTLFQFLFYLGWTKVAEALLNPFGNDDDDLEVNWLIDRNFQVGFRIVDQVDIMEPQKDLNFDNPMPQPLYSAKTVDSPIHRLEHDTREQTSETKENVIMISRENSTKLSGDQKDLIRQCFEKLRNHSDRVAPESTLP